jgi:glutamyl-Q tRNA(Asp) synthetase
VIYPGTCRHRPQSGTPRPDDAALRLDIAAAAKLMPRDAPLRFAETGHGPDGESGTITVTASDLVTDVGDIVLSRRDFPGSYHLSVVVDDAAQAITHVVRGNDLFAATHIHVLLQRLLKLPTPVYHHHRLIRDAHGKRLAKRDDARAIRTYREAGATPADIRSMVGL